MDATAATAITNADYASRISTAVARKAMDSAKQQGDAAVALLQSAVKNAPQPAVVDGRLDVTA